MVLESVAGCQFQPSSVAPDHCKSPNLKRVGVKTSISPMTSQASTKNSQADRDTAALPWDQLKALSIAVIPHSATVTSR